ncbi:MULTISPECIES: hypothetical protein, partial [unclassified Microcoleus]|uniref:hypothetical protein n=1 Tax=unclassified Microcoleus TaxID=2642155 RepID=UPI002FD2F817
DLSPETGFIQETRFLCTSLTWKVLYVVEQASCLFLRISCGAFKLEIRDRLEARPTRVLWIFDTQFKCRTAYGPAMRPTPQEI